MTLDDRLKKGILYLATQVSADSEAKLGTVMHAGQRRRVLRRTTAALGALAILLIALYATGGLLNDLSAQQVDTAGRPNETGTDDEPPETGGESGSGSAPQSSRSEQSRGSSAGTRSSGGGSIPGESPGIKNIAFNRSMDIYLIGADGSRLRFLTQGVAPSWSPEGRRIAFSTSSSGGSLQLINADGSERHGLGAAGAFPAWSPQGNRLTFNWKYDSNKVGCRPWNESEGDPGPECGIGVVGTDGSGSQWIGTGRWPDWGPDDRIVFGDGMPEQPCRYSSTYTAALLETAARAGPPQCHLPLWVMNSEGSGRLRLPVERAIAPTWSPDGRKIAFYQENGGIFISSADGKDVTNIAPAGYSEPSWSRDGRWLAVTRETVSFQWSIYLINVDGSDRGQVTSGARDTLPAVAP